MDTDKRICETCVDLCPIFFRFDEEITMFISFKRFLLLSIAAALIVTLIGAQPAPAQDDDWPTDGWRTSTPEEQGIDSVRLAEMFAYIAEQDLNMHSLLIVRNGYLVAEMYRPPYTVDRLHHVFSVTKSFTSALIGMALADGTITSLDQRLVDFFPDRAIANLDDQKRAITLEHLLTMSSGLAWGGDMLEQPSISALCCLADWVQYVLDLPMADEPGTRFVYNSGGSHLLSAVFQAATGEAMEDYAADRLFAPLGITDWQWRRDPQLISTGGWGLWLMPRDMAKFGYLYLRGGQWDGQPIIPAEWVAASTQAQISAGRQWLADDYGYQWWIDDNGYFMALGYGGQYIIVAPDYQMVVVVTSNLPLEDFFAPEDLLNTYILPASESAGPLPANPDGVAAMNAAVALLRE
jgi:CubicO group peptidase (beta-lactamase class C family)